MNINKYNNEIDCLEQDKQEIEKLIKESDRLVVINMLKNYMFNLNNSIDSYKSSIDKENKLKELENEVESFIVLDKYLWDDNKKNVKIYLYCEQLKEIKNINNKEDVTCNFYPSYFEIKIINWKNKNYKFNLKNIYKDYDFKNSKYKLTNEGILVTLVKFKEEPWMILNNK